MQRRTLNNGASVPRIGFGVWPLTDDQAYTAVTHALDVGYRRIDTAQVYGNEAGVGRAVRDSGIPRQDVFLTTKLWNADQGYDAALHAFDASLRRLGTDYIDLYLIHWPTPEQNLYVASYKALERLHAEGRAKAIGVSNFTATTLDRLLAETGTIPALNQIELHPYLPQTGMRTIAAEQSIATEAWSPLAQGGRLLAEPVLARLAEKYGKTAGPGRHPLAPAAREPGDSPVGYPVADPGEHRCLRLRPHLGGSVRHRRPRQRRPDRP